MDKEKEALMDHTAFKEKIIKLTALALLMGLLSGCAAEVVPQTTEPSTATETATVPEYTHPADGNADDVTCKGSYIVDAPKGEAIAATMGEAVLTNAELLAWYYLEVSDYRQSGNETAPDFDIPLESQFCPLAEGLTWQQYFLQRALNRWHGARALMMQGDLEKLPTEEFYQPIPSTQEAYMTGMPATRLLYGYNDSFIPNDLHQAYLDEIPTLVEGLNYPAQIDADALAACVEVYNRGYMFFTELCYALEPSAEAVEAYLAEHEADYAGVTGRLVDVRHILLIPKDAEVAADGTVTCSEEAWDAAMKQARDLLGLYHTTWKEATFANIANKNSQDPGSRLNGGLYSGLRQGQLEESLDEWCFDENRSKGDTEIIRSSLGVHVLYFSGSREARYVEAEKAVLTEMAGELVTAAKEKYPMTVDYSAIELAELPFEADVTVSDVLYPDVAHERYPCVPLYIQQDYPFAPYGNYMLASHGCGITTMAMLASYMTDDQLTPPYLAGRYGNYCLESGTDNSLFANTPAQMGFYLVETTREWSKVEEALKNGQMVVSLQYKGYFTRAGHFLVIERFTEDGNVVIRDSNVLNYERLPEHAVDSFDPKLLLPANINFWIYEKKIVTIPACDRCGDPVGEGVPAVLLTDYSCPRCGTSSQRRENYLAFCDGQ